MTIFSETELDFTDSDELISAGGLGRTSRVGEQVNDLQLGPHRTNRYRSNY